MAIPTVEELLATPVHDGLAVSPDGTRVLTSSNASGTFHAVEVLFCGTVSPRTSEGEDAVLVLDYLPDGKSFLVTRDSGGDELFHVYVVGEEGEELRDVLRSLGRDRPRFEGVTGPVEFDENGDIDRPYVVEVIGPPGAS